MEKKKYEAPVVTRVAIEFSDRIIAGGCTVMLGSGACYDAGAGWRDS